MTTGQANLFYAQLIIEELRRQGIRYFVICPGYRSAPLAIALAGEDRTTRIVHHDERGAAYHAVGYARATGFPAAVITTSGTAAANLFPAVVEASMDHLPLVVITADRPPELRDCGANQTIDQVKLFGDYVRFFADLPCPDDSPDPASMLTTIDHAVDLARRKASAPGPVHLNCMFREPLVPDQSDAKPLDMVKLLGYPSLSNWAETERALTSCSESGHDLPGEVAHDLAKIVRKTESGLFMVGRLDTTSERQEALHLSRALGWPTVVDITSGLALTDEPFLIHHHDLLLASEQFRGRHHVDSVIHVGGRFVSKQLLELLRESRPSKYIHNSAESQVIDPAGVVTQRMGFSNVSFCHTLALKTEPYHGDSTEASDWPAGHDAVTSVLLDLIDKEDALTEPTLARIVSQAQNSASALFLAGSMPIRDMDMFATHTAGIVAVASNRGASGIDGNTATACGYANGLGQPTTLVIGDLAFLHDLSSLSLVSESPVPLTVVVINNNGGRIFEQLPAFDFREIVETYFVAPHGMTFEKIAEVFKIAYAQADSPASFKETYLAAQKSDRPVIIEAIVDPDKSRTHRRDIIESVTKTIDRL